MHFLDLTLETAAENVALDEALLQLAEQPDREEDLECLRLWEPRQWLVVIGRSSRVDQEVDRAACQREQVPIIRRSSGGAAIVTGPGCLMYAVVLSLRKRPDLEMIDRAHQFVLQRIAAALASLGVDARLQGQSDLALGRRKISGNSMRRSRTHLLYHGTLLYEFDLGMMARLLRMPPRQPAYRQQREHLAFVQNLPLSAASIRDAVQTAWSAETRLIDWPASRTRHLVEQKYRLDTWNFSR